MVNDTIAQFDRYPELRTSYATALQYVNEIYEGLSMHLEYRYYEDTWDMKSHTAKGELFYDLMDNLMIGTRVRVYNQTKAGFVKKLNDYSLDDAYIVSDYRLSDLQTQSFGISMSYRPGFIDDENIAIKMSYDWYQTDNNAYIENWYGASQIKASFLNVALAYDF